jgi:hypothetical protein
MLVLEGLYDFLSDNVIPCGQILFLVSLIGDFGAKLLFARGKLKVNEEYL